MNPQFSLGAYFQFELLFTWNLFAPPNYFLWVSWSSLFYLGPSGPFTLPFLYLDFIFLL